MDNVTTPLSSTLTDGFKAATKPMTKTQATVAHVEGPVALAIEQQTAKLPSDLFLWAACGTMAASLAFQAVGMFSKKPASRYLGVNRTPPGAFIGMWTSTFLLLGIYNKLVKVAGSDQLRG